MAVMTSFGLWRYRRRPTGYYSDWQPREAARQKAMEQATRAKQRGEAFVNLYAAAKQLVDNYPKRFPYLEYDVRQIEEKGLVPPLDNGRK